MAFDPGDTQVQHVTLAVKQMFAAHAMSLQHEGLGRWNLTTHVDDVLRALVVRVRAMLAGYDLIEPIDVAYPRDWWQAVKQRFAPAWVLRRWPVDVVRHHIEVFDLHPALTLPPTCGPAIRMAVHTQDGWDVLRRGEK